MGELNETSFNYGNSTLNSTRQNVNEKAADNSLLFYQYVVGVYVDGFLCCMGLVGNCLILVCLSREKSRTSNTIFLQALAVFDQGLVIAEVLLPVLLSIDAYHESLPFTRSPWYLFLILPLGWTFQTCCIWTVMVIAIDRYLIVGYPLKSSRWCTPYNAKKVVITMAITAAIFNIPRWPFYFFVLFEQVGESLYTSHQEAGIAAFDEALYRKIYHTSLSIVFLFVIPLVIIIVLNIRLIWYVKQAMKQRQAMTQKKEGASEGNQNLTVTLIMVIMITIFVICNLPDFIASLIGAGLFKVGANVYGYYAASKEILLIINSSINFYIYIIFYKKFRQNLMKIFGFKTSGDSLRSQNTSVTMTTTGGTKGTEVVKDTRM